MKTIKFKYANGVEVEDLVSGITGIINGSCLWLNGCKQYSVQPKTKDGENSKVDSWWIDEAQLRKLSDGLSEKIETKDTGGPSMRSTNSKVLH